jgi:Uncharacterized protein conserved in bacteria (DUF2332)
VLLIDGQLKGARLDETMTQDMIQIRSRVRRMYMRFAESEALGISPLYEELARTICFDEDLTDFISSLPPEKQQPNLVFAVVRHLYGTPRDTQHFKSLIETGRDPIRAMILARSTQTNEPGRCSTLIPVLARLPQPLALIEVGASAGLCLLPDYYGYDYGTLRLAPAARSGVEAPVFPCVANALTPLPGRLPAIVWRRGLDLRPIDLADDEEVSWLETLVWPGQEPRLARLRAAMDVARDVRPSVDMGNLLTDVRALAATAPADATLVIFHSAVLGYLSSRHDIDTFVSTVRELRAVWISNEATSVLPDISAGVRHTVPRNRFLLAVDGKPVAFTGAHGQSIDWFAD